MMKLATRVGLGPGHIVLDGEPAHLSQRWWSSLTFRPYLLALEVEVGLGPRHIVLDGDPGPLPKKGIEPPTIFGPYLLWPNG